MGRGGGRVVELGGDLREIVVFFGVSFFPFFSEVEIQASSMPNGAFAYLSDSVPMFVCRSLGG